VSRIGKQPVKIPEGVEVTIKPALVTAKGPKGTDEVAYTSLVKVEQVENEIIVTRTADDKESRSQHGLVRALIQNLVTGVSQGFSRELEIIGTGYTVSLQQGGLLINVGYSHPIFVGPIDGIDYQVKGNTNLSVSGVSKYLVGEISAKIRSIRPPEPFKGKGIRYKNEYVRRKAGKTVGS